MSVCCVCLHANHACCSLGCVRVCAVRHGYEGNTNWEYDFGDGLESVRVYICAYAIEEEEALEEEKHIRKKI